MANTEDLDEYDDIEVKPNHSTAQGGMILAVAATIAGVIMLSVAEEAWSIGVGQSLVIAGLVGLFLMIATVAVVSAIYKNR